MNKLAEVIVPDGNELRIITHRYRNQGGTVRNPFGNKDRSIIFCYWVTDSLENM